MEKIKKRDLTPFEQAVYETVTRIPRGRVLSYAEVARRAGFPGAARAVGTAMKQNPDPRRIPCHRVVRSDGRIGEYAFGGPSRKADRLKREGIPVSHTGRVFPKR